MNKIGKIFNFFAALILFSLFLSVLSAQVLFTGKTSGKKNGSLYLFGTANKFDGVVSSNNWAGLVLGATNKVDFVVGYGDMTTPGEHFPYLATGAVVSLPTKELGFDSMVYQLFSLPNANRENSSTAFGNSVFIVSKDFTVKGHTLTPYSGYNGSYAFGPKDRLMTFSKPTHQVPVGLFAPLSKKWGITAEYDFGKMRSLGIALNYSFQY